MSASQIPVLIVVLVVAVWSLFLGVAVCWGLDGGGRWWYRRGKEGGRVAVVMVPALCSLLNKARLDYGLNKSDNEVVSLESD